MTVRILIADDHKVVRQGLRMFLDLDADLEVVGEAENGKEALRLAEKLHPDVVLMDLVMPVMDGIEATSAIRKELPETEVVALTSVLEDASVSGAVKAGAIGYLLKTTEADELCEAIKAAAEGKVQLAPEAAERLMREVRAPESPEALTRRETEVLKLLARGQAKHRREDGKDPRLQHPDEARGKEPHPGGPLCCAHRARVRRGVGRGGAMTADPAEKREASMVDGQPGSELHLNTLLDHPTELLDIFFDRMPMGIAVFDRDLLLRRCNPTWADFVAHYTETPFNEVVLGKSFFDLAPGTEEATMPLFERVLAGETVRQEALQLQSGGGPLSYWDVVFTPLVEEGRVVGFIDVVIDATERTLAEKELRESEERFRSLVTNSSDMITIFAPDGTRLYASPSTERILGYAPEDAVGGNYSDVVHPDDLPKIREEFAERARTPGTGRRFEFRARHADGSWRALESVGTNRVEDSRVGGIVFNARDITERKRTEQALKQERDFSSAVLDTAGSLVVVFDIEGRIVRFNRACERLSGYSFEEVQGRRYWELFLAPEDVEPVKAVMEEVRSRRLPNTNENHWVMRDGSRRLISWSNAILLDEQGEPAYLIGTGIDITEQRQAEDELKESQRALTTL
jgi:PAS domain S-box-containing protein